MSERDLFNWRASEPTLGELLRDEGIERVRAKYGPWIDRALMWILGMPSGHEFTTDELWLRSEELPPDLKPRERRAMGAVITGATRRGIVFPTGRFTKSKRPECHARPVAVWRRS